MLLQNRVRAAITTPKTQPAQPTSGPLVILALKAHVVRSPALCVASVVVAVLGVRGVHALVAGRLVVRRQTGASTAAATATPAPGRAAALSGAGRAAVGHGANLGGAAGTKPLHVGQAGLQRQQRLQVLQRAPKTCTRLVYAVIHHIAATRTNCMMQVAYQEVGLLVGQSAGVLLQLLLALAQLLRQVVLLRQLVLRIIGGMVGNELHRTQSTSNATHRVEILQRGEVAHHATLALLPLLLLLGAVQLDARDGAQVLQVVIAGLLAQALVLQDKFCTLESPGIRGMQDKLHERNRLNDLPGRSCSPSREFGARGPGPRPPCRSSCGAPGRPTTGPCTPDAPSTGTREHIWSKFQREGELMNKLRRGHVQRRVRAAI
jgi:hypothetical protein